MQSADLTAQRRRADPFDSLRSLRAGEDENDEDPFDSLRSLRASEDENDEDEDERGKVGRGC